MRAIIIISGTFSLALQGSSEYVNLKIRATSIWMAYTAIATATATATATAYNTTAFIVSPVYLYRKTTARSILLLGQ